MKEEGFWGPDVEVWVNKIAEHRDAVIIELGAAIEGEYISVKGCARRHPDDKPNKKIGLQYATARAFELMAQKITKRADGLVKQAEDLKERKEDLRERKEGPTTHYLRNLFGAFWETPDFKPWETYSETKTGIANAVNRDTEIHKPKPSPKRRISKWDSF